MCICTMHSKFSDLASILFDTCIRTNYRHRQHLPLYPTAGMHNYPKTWFQHNLENSHEKEIRDSCTYAYLWFINHNNWCFQMYMLHRMSFAKFHYSIIKAILILVTYMATTKSSWKHIMNFKSCVTLEFCLAKDNSTKQQQSRLLPYCW